MVVIISININGLLCPEKLEKVCAMIKDMNADITLIQETHWDNSFCDRYIHKFNGKVYANNFISGSRGCAIFVHSKYKDCVEYTENDQQGRYIMLKIRLNETLFAIHNIYASNTIKEREIFFKLLKQKIKPNENNIVGGDFNTWLSKSDISQNMVWLSDKSRYSLYELMDEASIKDIWRNRNKHDRVFSRHQMVMGKMKQSRIDFFLVGSNLLSEITNIHYRPTKLSDHDFVVLNLNATRTERGPGLWAFNNTLLQNIEFCESIHKAIENSLNCPLYNRNTLTWWDNLKYKFKKIAQIHGKRINYNQKEKYNRISNKLIRMYREAAVFPDKTDYNKIEEIEKELSYLEQEKCNGAIIRSKCQWAIESDKNTSYFLGLEKQRQNFNSIKELKDDDGNTYSDTDSILNIEYKFYSKLYSKENIDIQAVEKILSYSKEKIEQTDRDECEEPLTKEEIKLSLSGMGKNKSPGNDGLTVEFYMFFYEKLINSLLKVYKEIENRHEMSRSMKCAVISLIYKKKGNKADLKNWRPISLLNVDYKILARCFSNRLKYILPSIVNKFQTSCVPGRTIHDNVANIRDIISIVDSEDEGYILKLDQMKAFDRVSHEYLFSVLNHMGFGDNFISWIRIFYTDIISATKCNGHVSKYFKIERSVRQGCPLSAMLYVLCAEPLYQAISTELIGDGIKIPLTESESIMYQHADDSTITISNILAIQKVLDTFNLYGKASGAKLNLDKSEILPLGRGREKINSNTANFRVVNGILEVLGVFLGPRFEECEKLNWNKKITQTKSLLGWWKQRQLTLNGKAIVLNSLIMSKYWYTLYTQPLPVMISNQLKNIIQSFIWDNKPPKISYHTLCLGRCDGGLSIPDIEVKRDQFRINYLKKYFSPEYDNTWKKCMKYFLTRYANMGLLDQIFTIELSRKYMTNIPETYKELLCAWDNLKNNRVLEHDSPYFYQQPLFLNRNIMNTNKVLYYKTFIDSGIVTVSDITYEVIPGFLPEEAICEMVQTKYENVDPNKIKQDYKLLIQCIPTEWKMYISCNSMSISRKENIFIQWNDSKTHVVDTPKSTFKDILSKIKDRQPKSINTWKQIYPNVQFDKNLWKNVFLKEKPPDCIDVDYRILHRIVFSMEKLTKLGIVQSPICPICNSKTEDFLHIFINCTELEILHIELIKCIENSFKNADPTILNKHHYNHMLLFGIPASIKNVNTFFLNIMLSIARLSIYRRRFAVINNNTKVDVLRLFRYTTKRYIEYLIQSKWRKSVWGDIFTNNFVIREKQNTINFL